jgi:hypothetical protein
VRDEVVVTKAYGYTGLTQEKNSTPMMWSSAC